MQNNFMVMFLKDFGYGPFKTLVPYINSSWNSKFPLQKIFYSKPQFRDLFFITIICWCIKLHYYSMYINFQLQKYPLFDQQVKNASQGN